MEENKCFWVIDVTFGDSYSSYSNKDRYYPRVFPLSPYKYGKNVINVRSYFEFDFKCHIWMIICCNLLYGMVLRLWLSPPNLNLFK